MMYEQVRDIANRIPEGELDEFWEMWENDRVPIGNQFPSSNYGIDPQISRDWTREREGQPRFPGPLPFDNMPSVASPPPSFYDR